jgi:hypothetical protein
VVNRTAWTGQEREKEKMVGNDHSMCNSQLSTSSIAWPLLESFIQEIRGRIFGKEIGFSDPDMSQKESIKKPLMRDCCSGICIEYRTPRLN